MGLESNPQTIADLVPSYPEGGDGTPEGDNHIRNLKRILQNVFPNGQGGIGFDSPVLSTVDELNYLQGSTENVQLAIDELRSGVSESSWIMSGPAGGRISWFSKTLPDGWFIELDVPYSLMVCASPSAVAGDTIGTDDPVAWSHSHAVQPFTLTNDNLPSHNHAIFSGGVPSSEVDRNDGGSATGFGSSIGGSSYTGTTEGFGGGQPVSNVITAPTEFKPRIVHCVILTREDRPEE